jgi:hypothetical protein
MIAVNMARRVGPWQGIGLCLFTLLVAVACSPPSTPPVETKPRSAVSGECPALDAAAIASVTGTPVRAVARGSFPGGGGTCANYVTEAGQPYLGINDLAAIGDYASTIAAVPSAIYPVKTPLTGVGDEAILFQDQAERPSIRFLVAHQASHTIVLFPLSGATSLTTAQLQQLAATALSQS